MPKWGRVRAQFLGADHSQGRALLDHWRNELGGTERNVLDVLVAAHPQATSHAEVAEVTGYSPGSSTIGVAMSKLRRLEIAEGWSLSRDFVEAVQL